MDAATGLVYSRLGTEPVGLVVDGGLEPEPAGLVVDGGLEPEPAGLVVDGGLEPEPAGLVVDGGLDPELAGVGVNEWRDNGLVIEHGRFAVVTIGPFGVNNGLEDNGLAVATTDLGLLLEVT